MSLAASLALGILSALPLAAILFLRWRRFSRGMDRRAAMAFAKRAFLLAAGSALASALLFLFGGRLPAPAAWQLALAAAGAGLFLRAIGRKRRDT